MGLGDGYEKIFGLREWSGIEREAVGVGVYSREFLRECVGCDKGEWEGSRVC